jgi:hypothetical protein
MADNSRSSPHAQNSTPSAPFIPNKQVYPSEMTPGEFDRSFPIPQEFRRIPSGSSVIEPDSVLAANGRSYHGYKEGSYILPNDAAEQDRLDFQHMMVNIMLDGRLYTAPLTETPKVRTTCKDFLEVD